MIHMPLLHLSSCSGPPEVAGVGTVEGAGNGDRLWADHGEEVWCGTCLDRLSPGLPGSRRAKDDANGIQRDPLCMCVEMSE